MAIIGSPLEFGTCVVSGPGGQSPGCLDGHEGGRLQRVQGASTAGGHGDMAGQKGSQAEQILLEEEDEDERGVCKGWWGGGGERDEVGLDHYKPWEGDEGQLKRKGEGMLGRRGRGCRKGKI